ncbi:MAG: TM2 domain-containing protein [Sphingobacterium thalpophilum]|jgi:TM2 domain-containing membrane protein YozV
MENDPFVRLKGMGLEEYSYLKQVVSGMNPRQTQNFVLLYSDRRKDPQEILLFTLLGFLGVAGIQRFIIGQVGMGILYFLTAGLCFIGTIVDVVNHKSLTLEYNRKAAYESAELVKIMASQGNENLS